MVIALFYRMHPLFKTLKRLGGVIMSRLFKDIVKGFKEIGEMINSESLVNLASNILKDEKVKSLLRSMININKRRTYGRHIWKS